VLHETLIRTALLVWGVISFIESMKTVGEVTDIFRTRSMIKRGREARQRTYRGVRSSGKHQKAIVDGEIAVCDTCTNSLGYNVAWEHAGHGESA
jgi:hypothetical protein